MLKPFYRIDGKLRFCPSIECSHYGKATKYSRKCYYEPQCWRGYLDMMIAVVRIRFGRDYENNKSTNEARRDKERETGTRNHNSSHARPRSNYLQEGRR